MNKEIYSFKVNKKVKVDVVEELPDGSKLTRTEDQEKPVKITIKSPSRTDVSDSEFEYAKEYGRLFRAGIMTKEMVKKAYDSGSFFEDKRKQVLELVAKLQDVQARYASLVAESKSEEKDEAFQLEEASLQKDWVELNAQLQSVESSVDAIFANTAEVIAERYVISYLTLVLTVGEDGRNVFKGDTHEARLKNYDALSAIDGPYYAEIGEKSSYVVGLFYSGKASEKEEFDAFFGIKAEPETVDVKSEAKEAA